MKRGSCQRVGSFRRGDYFGDMCLKDTLIRPALTRPVSVESACEIKDPKR